MHNSGMRIKFYDAINMLTFVAWLFEKRVGIMEMFPVESELFRRHGGVVAFGSIRLDDKS